MPIEICESDWKLFRKLRAAALNRFCETVLREITSVASDDAKTSHKRYLEIYQLVREKDRKLANAFNDMRRSTALLHLSIIHSYGLLTEEEILQFTPEARDAFT